MGSRSIPRWAPLHLVIPVGCTATLGGRTTAICLVIVFMHRSGASSRAIARGTIGELDRLGS